jgi:hypothetical protein
MHDGQEEKEDRVFELLKSVKKRRRWISVHEVLVELWFLLRRKEHWTFMGGLFKLLISVKGKEEMGIAYKILFELLTSVEKKRRMDVFEVFFRAFECLFMRYSFSSFGLCWGGMTCVYRAAIFCNLFFKGVCLKASIFSFLRRMEWRIRAALSLSLSLSAFTIFFGREEELSV